ncbi:hypothetical protein XENOCAPTIV_020362 [Xenoophorus captivus]|uniref:Uncharacterized protein n=1 Tax=Xenoophorus captivus TaxID=1517983 RepID=A0ABV0RZN7_9TELE
MECNDAKTQCTIGLAHRPCQELTGWTELCRSHYDNDYNTYAHEVVWRKTEGVWRRSFGGGSTCAEIVLGHNLRHRKSIMDVIVPFIPDSVVALAELYAFRQHLCTGSIDKGFDWVGENLFYSNLTCKLPKETWKNCGEGAYQHACTWYETLGHSIGNTHYKVIWTSAFGAAARTFKIRPWQGGLYLPIISYIWRDPTDGFWLPTLHLLDGRVVAIGAHGSPDSPPQVTEVQVRQVSTTTTESSTQTSVTTKSVTCQTTVGDNDEQHQLVSLGELVLQNSPTEDPVCEESGPPQLADEWMNEVMLTTPPQPFSPLSPLPPLLSPIRSPIATASPEESVADGSPSPPVLRKELLSSPLRMHPDFIDEFQILDVWSPTPGPPSPHYQDYTEDGVLSLFVYDEDFL